MYNLLMLIGTTWLQEIVSYIHEGGESEFTNIDMLKRIPFMEYGSSSTELNLGRRIFKSHLQGKIPYYFYINIILLTINYYQRQ